MIIKSAVYRDFHKSAAFGLGAEGISTTVITMTSSRRLRVVGWCFDVKMIRFSPAAVVGGYAVGLEITRATEADTNYGLDRGDISGSVISDVAAADIVGGVGQTNLQLKRHLSDREADDLGLILDYGESIRCIGTLTQAGVGATQAQISGFFYYEEV